jgi:hypothetical protein
MPACQGVTGSLSYFPCSAVSAGSFYTDSTSRSDDTSGKRPTLKSRRYSRLDLDAVGRIRGSSYPPLDGGCPPVMDVIDRGPQQESVLSSTR